MKKKIILLLALVLVFSTFYSIAGYAVESDIEDDSMSVFQTINFVNAVVTSDGLNVRQGTSTRFPIVCVLRKGQTVKIIGKIGDWYAVYEPTLKCVGAAYSKYLSMAGTTPSAPPAVTPKPPAATPAPIVKPPAATVVPTPPPGVSQDEQTMLNLVNKARADAGVGPLAFDTKLQNVARMKAKDMVDNNYFSHQSPTYGSPFDMMRQFDVSFRTAGENIAGNSTVKGAFDAWMNSEGHRKNILNGNFNFTGIGIVSSPTYGKIFVQQFIGK